MNKILYAEITVFRHITASLIALVCSALFSTPLFAQQYTIITTGKGEALSIDSTSIPVNLKSNLEVMKKKCIKCHTLERTITSLQKGITPSGKKFNKLAVKAYGIKMLKKPDSDMSGSEVKTVLELLYWFHDEIAK